MNDNKAEVLSLNIEEQDNIHKNISKNDNSNLNNKVFQNVEVAIDKDSINQEEEKLLMGKDTSQVNIKENEQAKSIVVAVNEKEKIINKEKNSEEICNISTEKDENLKQNKVSIYANRQLESKIKNTIAIVNVFAIKII